MLNSGALEYYVREGCSNYISILLPRQRQYFTGCKKIELAELKETGSNTDPV